jgi:hypothetical protein
MSHYSPSTPINIGQPWCIFTWHWTSRLVSNQYSISFPFSFSLFFNFTSRVWFHALLMIIFLVGMWRILFRSRLIHHHGTFVALLIVMLPLLRSTFDFFDVDAVPVNASSYLLWYVGFVVFPVRVMFEHPWAGVARSQWRAAVSLFNLFSYETGLGTCASCEPPFLFQSEVQLVGETSRFWWSRIGLQIIVYFLMIPFSKIPSFFHC